MEISADVVRRTTSRCRSAITSLNLPPGVVTSDTPPPNPYCCKQNRYADRPKNTDKEGNCGLRPDESREPLGIVGRGPSRQQPGKDEHLPNRSDKQHQNRNEDQATGTGSALPKYHCNEDRNDIGKQNR